MESLVLSGATQLSDSQDYFPIYSLPRVTPTMENARVLAFTHAVTVSALSNNSAFYSRRYSGQAVLIVVRFLMIYQFLLIEYVILLERDAQGCPLTMIG